MDATKKEVVEFLNGIITEDRYPIGMYVDGECIYEIQRKIDYKFGIHVPCFELASAVNINEIASLVLSRITPPSPATPEHAPTVKHIYKELELLEDDIRECIEKFERWSGMAIVEMRFSSYAEVLDESKVERGFAVQTSIALLPDREIVWNKEMLRGALGR